MIGKIEEAVDAFVKEIDRGPFKELGKSEERKSSNLTKNSDETIYQLAVRQAWLDMCRTAGGISEGARNEVLKKIGEQLEAYFNDEAKDKNGFDNWHKDKVKPINGLSCGQLQKIINMAFKYLYCCEDFRADYNKYFQHCHMPLDSYTLNWVRERTAIKKTNKWSKLNEEEYLHIVKCISKVLNEESPLVKEFTVWPEERRKQDEKELEAMVERCIKDGVTKEAIEKIVQNNMK